MKLLSQVFVIARIEARFYAHYPKLFLATAAVALIPALYVVIYLSSMWDPAAHTGALPVGVVNLDRDVEYREHTFNVGREIASRLKARKAFGYRDYTDEQAARELVRQGRLAFVLVIPHDFSSNALPGVEAGGGRLVVYTSEGNSYQSAGLARRFAEDLGHEVNKSLNERRWALVLSSALGSERNIDRLRDGVDQLRTGAKALAVGANKTAAGADSLSHGMGRLDEGVQELTSGVKELGAGLRTMDARRPSNAEVNQVKQGADALGSGQLELGRGLAELQTGVYRLRDGVTSFRTEAASSVLVAARITEGLDQFADGVSQLDSGLQAATGAQRKLTEGADRLSAGVGVLTAGVNGLGAGIHTAVTKLPADSQLDELSTGAQSLAGGSKSLSEGVREVKAGAQHLASGIDLLVGSLPVTMQKMDGSAEGLANSVLPTVEVTAAVQNNGSGFAPNIIPGALWLGAGIAAFLIHVRVLPRQAMYFSRPAQMLGKILIPSAVVLVQSLLVMVSVLLILKIPVTSPLALAMTLGVASVTFLVIVFALTRAFGDAGKGLAMMFLAVQLSSSGGILPVELSGGVFMDISPWLPLTWVVRGIKASMFGAYDGAWQYPLLLVGLAGMAAATLACTVGHWRFVKQAAIRPAVDF